MGGAPSPMAGVVQLWPPPEYRIKRTLRVSSHARTRTNWLWPQPWKVTSAMPHYQMVVRVPFLVAAHAVHLSIPGLGWHLGQGPLASRPMPQAKQRPSTTPKGSGRTPRLVPSGRPPCGLFAPIPPTRSSSHGPEAFDGFSWRDSESLTSFSAPGIPPE